MGCQSSKSFSVSRPVVASARGDCPLGCNPSIAESNNHPVYDEHQALLRSAGSRYAQIVPAFQPGDCLLIVDMQNDFLPVVDAPDGGRLPVTEGADAAAAIVELAKQAAASDALIVATRDYHPKNHCSFVGQNGPFPSHCVQGSKGAEFFAPIEEVLSEVRGNGADVRVVFKGFSPEVDSFGAIKYDEQYFKEKALGHGLGTTPDTPLDSCCCALDWTGSFCLECSNLDEDLNAPPDVLSVFCRQTLADVFEEAGVNRVFVCGLAMDVCVLDSALNAATAGLAPEGVYLIIDATRAVHLPGVGPFGSGFITDPKDIVKKTWYAGVKLVHSHAIGIGPLASSQDAPRLLGQERALVTPRLIAAKQ